MRDVLALCNDFRSWGPGVRYASELARILDASLTAIHVEAPIPSHAPRSIPPSLLAEFVAYAQDEVQSAMRAGTRFADWTRQFGVRSAHWLVALGDTADVLHAAGNWNDVLVLERRGDGVERCVELVSELLLSGVACLAVPDTTYAIGRLERIAVVCNGSPSSRRALHGALPMLRRATHVVLLEGGWRDREFDDISCRPAFDAAAHLRRHGVEVEVVEVATEGTTAGDALLEAASRNRVDLIVAGADGKRGFNECYLDATPQHLLRQTSLPLFMRH